MLNELSTEWTRTIERAEIQLITPLEKLVKFYLFGRIIRVLSFYREKAIIAL